MYVSRGFASFRRRLRPNLTTGLRLEGHWRCNGCPGCPGQDCPAASCHRCTSGLDWESEKGAEECRGCRILHALACLGHSSALLLTLGAVRQALRQEIRGTCERPPSQVEGTATCQDAGVCCVPTCAFTDVLFHLYVRLCVGASFQVIDSSQCRPSN